MSESCHAKLSPSAAERWMICPGSVVLSSGMPEKSSPYAEEGTKAHAIAEAIINGGNPPCDDEMRAHVMIYVNHVTQLVHRAPGKPVLHTEKRVQVCADVWGTADTIVWVPDTQTLYVRDLKYGAGVMVSVSDNMQLKTYALAALLTMNYPAKLVNVGIVQPRMPDQDGGTVRSKDYLPSDLLEFYGDMRHGIKLVRAAADAKDRGELWQKTYLTPSEKGCRWCLAAPVCPKLRTKSQELAAQVFAPELPYDPSVLAETLDFLPILEGWIKNVREFAYNEAEKGNAIPSYKLVDKTAIRKWSETLNPVDLAFALGVPKNDLFAPAPMKGVTDLQKLAPGKNDTERAAVLAPFVTKVSSGHTLVHESDKRDPIRLDAKAAFTE